MEAAQAAENHEMTGLFSMRLISINSKLDSFTKFTSI